MPFELPLPRPLKRQGWKVRIREKETREPPHVTILRRTEAWRINLRTGAFMDEHPSPAEVPGDLLVWIQDARRWKLLCEQWDSKYPDNPVSRGEGQHDED